MMHRLNLTVPVKGFMALYAMQWVLYAVIAGSLGASGWLWWSAQELDAAAVQYEEATQRIATGNRQFAAQSLRTGFDVSEPRLKTLGREVTFINQLLEKRAFSWTRLLTDLEATVPLKVSITSVTMNFKDSSLLLNGTALTIKDITGFSDSLEAHPSFRNVILSNYQVRDKQGSDRGRNNADDGPRGVDFMLTVTYKPES
jgi:hypothetical protein